MQKIKQFADRNGKLLLFAKKFVSGSVTPPKPHFVMGMGLPVFEKEQLVHEVRNIGKVNTGMQSKSIKRLKGS